MCMLCSDSMEICYADGCARDTINPRTNLPSRRGQIYSIGDIPCAHVLAEHRADCPLHQGMPCDYECP